MKLYILIFNFLFFFIFTQNNLYATNQPFCNNPDLFNDNNLKTNQKIQHITINVFKNKKLQKNNIRVLIGSNKGIQEKFKTKFKAKIDVKFDNDLECNFLGKIRQSGDMRDHIILKNNLIYQSLDVELTRGHINGIVKFKLLLDHTRGNAEEEVIITEILRSLGYLAPRTSLVRANVNGSEAVMIFQEKAVKELLEFNKRREGPILEGVENYMFQFQSNILLDGTAQFEETVKALENGAKIQLSRLSNSNWATRNINQLEISLNALTKLNQTYLLYLNSYKNSKNNFNFYEYGLSNKFLANQDLENIKMLNIYNILLFAAGADHGLQAHNRKFFWNTFLNSFEPIYYDGHLDFERGLSNHVYSDYYWLPINGDILNDANTLIEKLDKINLENILNNLILSGVDIDKDQLDLKIKRLKINIEDIKAKINKTDKDIIVFNESLTYDEDLWNNLTKNFNELNLNTKFISSKKDFKINNELMYKIKFSECLDGLKDCEDFILDRNKKEDYKKLRRLLESKLLINDQIYQFTSSNLDNEVYKKNKILNSHLYYTENIEFKFNEEQNQLDIFQKKIGARAYFFQGDLNSIKINFYGVQTNDTIEKIPNYPMDKKGLTGCLSFINLNLKKIDITSVNSNCEDSINLINVDGEINNIKISNSLSDGLDIDFSNIKIDDLVVNNSGNDCADFSFGFYEINNLKLENCGDKSLSVGEKSLIKLKNIYANNANIGIASKDSSVVKFEQASLSNVKNCLTAYNKKQEFNGGYIDGKNIKYKNFLKFYTKDIHSEIKIDNQL